MADSHLTELSFSSLHLPESLQKVSPTPAFERCTPIQAQTLPQALAGLDVAGQAQTGTGKTAAFLVAMYARADPREPPDVAQSQRAARADRRSDARAGGADPSRRRDARPAHRASRSASRSAASTTTSSATMLEQGVDVLIGTPGRIIDFSKQRVFDLRAVQVLMLDEADRMFDLGFISDIRYILRRLPAPEQRLNMLFSATLSQRVLELAYEHMNDPDAGAHRAGQDDGRQRASGDLLPRRTTRSRACWSDCSSTWTRAAAWCSSTRGVRPSRLEQLLRGERHQRRGDLRRRAAAQAAAHAARLPRGHARGADRHRRRLARPAHSGRQPRLQLRPAAGSRGLRAPHRPHRARRRRRRRDQLRLRGVRDLAAGHRGVHRPQDSGRVGPAGHAAGDRRAGADAPVHGGRGRPHDNGIAAADRGGRGATPRSATRQRSAFSSTAASGSAAASRPTGCGQQHPSAECRQGAAGRCHQAPSTAASRPPQR